MGRHLYVRKYEGMLMCVQEDTMTHHVITPMFYIEKITSSDPNPCAGLTNLSQ